MEHCTGWTAGLDLGDKYSYWVILDDDGDIVDEGRVRTTKEALRQQFDSIPPMRVVLEVGTHSRWVSLLLVKSGHDVIVANARKIALISQNERKSDRIDAELLARLGRADPKLLSPIEHRGKAAQAALTVLKSRDALVAARTKLINHVRGVIKATGHRLPSCSTTHFHKLIDDVPVELREAVTPVMELIEATSTQIDRMDERIEQLCEDSFPETELLMGVKGVGPITALAFVTILEDPNRFKNSRAVGPYLGLVPRRDQSGAVDKQLRISKTGDAFLRRLLVNASHYILGPFGPDTDLRRWGLHLAERGGKAAKKRAIVAVARKLAVLLHRLWLNGEVYDPLINARRRGELQDETESA